MIVSFYQSPKGNFHYFFDKLHEVLLSLHGVPYDLVLAGDLNLSLVERDQDKLKLYNSRSLGLRQCVTGITRPIPFNGNADTVHALTIFTSLHFDRWIASIIHTTGVCS